MNHSPQQKHRELQSANPAKVLRRGLAKHLHSSRIRRDERIDDCQRRLDKSLQVRVDRFDLQPSEFVRLVADGIEAIEAEVDEFIELGIQDLEILAEVYAVSPLMLESFRLSETQPTCVVHSIRDFLPAERTYGRKANYRLAANKLAGAEDVQVVFLELKPGGQSDIHSHPGDELLVVLEGTVEVRLENSGIHTQLSQGDYIHFFAEQLHEARNHSASTAKAFIVRFYHSEGTGVRLQSLDELTRKSPPKNAIRRVANEMKAALRFSMRTQSEAGDQVIDRFGLGRLLRMLCDQKFRGKGNALRMDELTSRGKSLGFSRAKFGRLHQGLAPVKRDQLVSLARIYEAEPLLFYDFLFPALRNVIVVRTDEDMRTISADMINDFDGTYSVPCRRLAESNVAIAILELPPNSVCPKNRHPGHEILLPLEGLVELWLGGETTTIDSDAAEFAQFDSGVEHYLRNIGNKWARIFVIRFYE